MSVLLYWCLKVVGDGDVEVNFISSDRGYVRYSLIFGWFCVGNVDLDGVIDCIFEFLVYELLLFYLMVLWLYDVN